MALTRRALLSSAAAIALVQPTFGQIAPPTDAGFFWGNPNVTITAIDTSGGIAVPRGAGYAPFFAHVSASAITAAGTKRPYEDLEYTWDFGDADGTEILTRPTDNAKVNANVQIGPEAAYCYRKPGTYTVTLMIRGCARIDASGKPQEFVSAKVTRNVTVAAFNAAGGHWYFDSASGSDGNDGRSPAKPKKSLSAIAEAANIAGAAIHLKRGSSWVHEGKGYAAVTIGQSPLRIDAYGSGPKPSITSNSRATIYMPNNKAFHDVVLTDLALVGGPLLEGSPFQFVQGPLFCTYVYLDNVDLTNHSTKGSQGGSLYFAFAGGAADRIGAKAWIGGGTWNCTGRNPNQMFCAAVFGATQWMFHCGLTLLGDTKTHHINPENTDSHALYRWVKTVGAIESDYFSFCLACRVREYTGADHSYQLVTECYFEGGMDGISCNAPRNGPQDFVARAFIVERCAFNGLQRNVFYPVVLGEGTLRDNRFWKCDGGIHLDIGTGVIGYVDGKYYRNKHYKAGTRSHPAIKVHPEKTGSSKWEITDNEVYDARSGSNANAIMVNFADQVRAGSLINRNQYFAPNADGRFFTDNGSRKSFAEWQSAGFDKRGRVAKLNWPDPENGRF